MTGDRNLACAQAFVDALAAGGIRHACVSPGSRSTPLALAMARDDRVTVHVHLDERSAAYFALGIAKASGAPAAVVTTSGTAAAELWPAAVEAAQSRTPMVLVTADRPARLRGTGANQTIDQQELFGSYARAYIEPPVPTTDDDATAWRDAGRRAIDAAIGHPAGPAHVNAPFDEPLVPEQPAAPLTTEPWQPLTREPDRVATAAALDAFLDTFAGRPGVITIGSGPAPTTLSLLSLGELLGWPVLAEPLSGLRLDAGGAGRALAAGQHLISETAWLDRHRPEVVLQVGATPTTRTSQALSASADELIVLDDRHLDPDPARRAARRIMADPELFAAIAWDRAAEGSPPQRAPDAWSEAWRTADLVTHAAVDRLLDGWAEPFEGRIARDLGAFAPNGTMLAVGSSTPVRDLDVFMGPRRPPRIWHEGDLIRFVANRGASGIDGFTSTVLGAAAGTDRAVYSLMGDLTFLHDVGGLVWPGSRSDIDAVLVVISNGGGQIFSMLPQHELPEFERLFVTPPPVSVAAVCSAADVPRIEVDTAAGFIPALEGSAAAGGVRVVDVTVDPVLTLQRRDEVRAAVAHALRGR